MSYVESVIELVKEKNPNEPEFIQAVTEVLTSLEPVIEAHPNTRKHRCSSAWSSPSALSCFAFLG